jgi:hypothetical protein
LFAVLELDFLYRLRNSIKAFIISGHLPNSSGDSEYQYATSLKMLEELLARRSLTTIPFIGADLNARIGARAEYRIDEEGTGI